MPRSGLLKVSAEDIDLSSGFYFAARGPVLAINFSRGRNPLRKDIYQGLRLREPFILDGVIHSDKERLGQVAIYSRDPRRFPAGTLVLTKVFDGASGRAVETPHPMFALLPGFQQVQRNIHRAEVHFDEGRLAGRRVGSGVSSVVPPGVVRRALRRWHDKSQKEVHLDDVHFMRHCMMDLQV